MASDCDCRTGRYRVGYPLRWLIRYPHLRYRENLGMPVIDGHDVYNLRSNSVPETYSPRFACQPPILKDGRLYVAPADGEEVCCFDQETGLSLIHI